MKPGELGWCFHKDHMIIQVGRDLRRSLVQSLVWSRVSYENRPGCSGFSQSNLESLQQLRTQSLLKVCSTIVVSPQWEIFFPCIQSESLISIKPKAQLYLLDMLPKGPGRLLLGPLDAFSSPGWRSPAPSASPKCSSPNHLGESPTDLLQVISLSSIEASELQAVSRHGLMSAM